MIRPLFVFERAHVAPEHLELVFVDERNGLTYAAVFKAHQQVGLFEATATLQSKAPCRLSWLSAPVMSGFAHTSKILDFTGRWCGEFLAQETPWRAGAHFRDNPTGRSGHEHFPGAFIMAPDTSNNNGDVFGFHYAWSGGHTMLAEQWPDGQRQLQFGHAMDSQLSLDDRFETAPLYFTFSETGLNGCAIPFQRFVRANLKPEVQNAVRPVHFNCWEAVYFDHNLEQLKQIAQRAAEIGAERFVLDDGWFDGRNDDTSSLGDWTVDQNKFPDGLTPLIEHLKSMNMRFGLWFEPEMVNKKSKLYEEHPDWLLGDPEQISGRNQFVLDLSLQAVQDTCSSRFQPFYTNMIWIISSGITTGCCPTKMRRRRRAFMPCSRA